MQVIDNRGRIRTASVSVTDETHDYVERAQAGDGWRVNDNLFQIYNITIPSWVTIYITGVLGSEQIALGVDSTDPALSAYCIYMGKGESNASWRVQYDNFQLYNPTTDAWYTIYFVGGPALEQIQLGAADFSPTVGVGYMKEDQIGLSYTIAGRNFKLWNQTQSIFQTLFSQGDPPQIAIGA